jgi:hypothetical protein
MWGFWRRIGWKAGRDRDIINLQGTTGISARIIQQGKLVQIVGVEESYA